MITFYTQFGLGKEEIKEIIEKHLKENADILMGIDDPEVNQLVNILVEAFSQAIKENNEQLAEDIKNYVKDETKKEDRRGFRL